LKTINSAVMSVNPSMPQEIKNSSSELRFLELEAGYKKIDYLLKTVENLSKHLDEVKAKLVRNLEFRIVIYSFFKLKLNQC